MQTTLFRRLALATCLAGAAFAFLPAASAQDASSGSMAAGESEMPMVGGAPMDPQKTIVENASTASNLTTLVAAVKAAGLDEALSGTGPFTVFAPTNEAFEKLPAGTVDELLKPENKEKLTEILTYHVVPASVMSKDAMTMIEEDGGEHPAKTLEGETITLSLDGDTLIITDAKGDKAKVTQADVKQSNGVVHVIDTVLMPGE
ncbi:MAG: fasciclin domain-containing protein [Fulvimarina manganoxydans]|uniref:fasciclin domain-containing protein n=1 Tax=Fulvimarina manganoxydans TaxID=937218 RepID=UPI0023558D2C|nr:fasciclin domain-containing protein [Fulvimarina manganoxydans]MCK5931374.1 fasciclin domain-containing protein [Fulvimarina manganoxydans]